MCKKSRKTKLIFICLFLLLFGVNGQAQEFLARVDFKSNLFRATDEDSFKASISYFLSGNRRFDLNTYSNCELLLTPKGPFPGKQNKIVLVANKLTCSLLKGRDYVYQSKRPFGIVVDYQGYLTGKKLESGIPVSVFPYQGNQLLANRLIGSIEKSDAYKTLKKKQHPDLDLKSYLARLDQKSRQAFLQSLGYGQYIDVITESLSKEPYYFFERARFYALVFNNSLLVNELYKYVIQ